MIVYLKECRKRAGISQAKLSAISGIPQQTISAIDNGTRKNPGVETLHPIAKALGCSIDELIDTKSGKDGGAA